MGIPDRVTEKLETLPKRAGVYVFRDHAGRVLYVGKARSLRSRVRSYFQPGSTDVRSFVARLEAELGDVETFVTQSEKEAALLESQLIKQLEPRYNIKLRDDKDFLTLRLALEAAWPRLEVVRRPRPDGALYFGPYHSATAARQTLRLVNRHFQLRTCTDSELRSRVRPCLQYQIKRCSAPCVFPVDRTQYGEQAKNVALFLDGRHDELVDDLEAKMSQSARELEYEQAAVYRDQIRAVQRVRESQRVAVVRDIDQDVVGLYRQADRAEVAVLLVRGGKLSGVRTFGLQDVSLPDDELIASFLREWYERSRVPDEVLLPFAVEAMDGLAQALEEQDPQSKRAVKLLVPERGAKKKLVAMALENAAHAFAEKRRHAEDALERLGQVQRRLRLPELPRRIECIDVSHSTGADTVASIVTLEDGAPAKHRYRSYHVKTISGGDDYGAMNEVLTRRLRRGRDAEAGWELPQLLVVDGGKGQLNVALAVLADLGVEGLPVVGLAKEKESPLGEKVVDRLYLPGQKNAIPVHGTPALQMLALARDEAHRASNELRQKLGRRNRLRSDLDSVKGIGPKTRNRLLQALGSVQAVREASLDELIAAGASHRQAVAIAAHFAPPSQEQAGDPSVDDAELDAIENAFRP